MLHVIHVFSIYLITGYPPPPAYEEQNKGVPSAYPPPGTGYPSQGYAQPGYGQTGYTHQSTTAVVVTQPGYAGQVVAMPRPPDYMIGSIMACLCCFWPTGLCAIYYASQASKLSAEGDMVGATNMANSARNLMITSIVIGVIWIGLVIVLRAIVYADYYSNSSY